MRFSPRWPAWRSGLPHCTQPCPPPWPCGETGADDPSAGMRGALRFRSGMGLPRPVLRRDMARRDGGNVGSRRSPASRCSCLPDAGLPGGARPPSIRPRHLKPCQNGDSRKRAWALVRPMNDPGRKPGDSHVRPTAAPIRALRCYRNAVWWRRRVAARGVCPMSDAPTIGRGKSRPRCLHVTGSGDVTV